MAEKIIIRGESYDGEDEIMQGVKERDLYLRRFPNPLPATHRFVYWWSDGGTRLHKRILPIEEIKPHMQVVEPVSEEPGTSLPPGPDDKPVSEEMRKLVAELNALPTPELDTRAGIVGVGLLKPGSTKRRAKAAIISDVANAEMKPAQVTA